jgi:hypothetical protein
MVESCRRAALAILAHALPARIVNVLFNRVVPCRSFGTGSARVVDREFHPEVSMSSKGRKQTGIRRILTPIDFQEVSMHALDYAVDLARQLGAELIVTHVYHIPVYGFLDASIIAPPDIAAKIADAAQNGLDAAVEARAKTVTLPSPGSCGTGRLGKRSAFLPTKRTSISSS